MPETQILRNIAGAVRELLFQPSKTLADPSKSLAHSRELEPLLKLTQARAVGCWRLDSGALDLVGFLAVDSMPLEIQTEFVDVTRHVPLERAEFGIVQAVLARGPAVNHRVEDPAVTTTGSLSWLARFQCASSLAIPIVQNSEIRGAIAVATGKRIDLNDEIGCLITNLAMLIFQDSPGSFIPS